ncbi:restriction endonuclease subunit S [Lelliottia amnigena]|uniref:restriction endonuclease subunit S n=1 Tax=Lelliottia amnigena TaxID=61646 RepID=UPI00192C2858|nr:restriction endonuclease subunit S [Lelliottia amnigena]MBL5922754.1 restriction endonuclease subunit S [Lelliottia amnigena]
MSFPMSMIGDVCEIIRGVTFGRSEGECEYFSGGIPIIRAGSIQKKLELDRDLIWVSNQKVRDIQKIRKNDILMCMSSGSSELVGKTAIAELDWDGSFGAFCALLRPKTSECVPKYLYYVLNSSVFREWTLNSSGSNIKNIRTSELNDFLIPLPSLDVQTRIANILEKIDEVRNKRIRTIKMVDDFLQSVFIEKFGDPSNNKNNYPIGTIRDLVDSVNYGTSAKASGKKGDIPILRMGNITYQGGWDFSDLKYIKLTKVEEEKYLVCKGDLLFNRTNSKELVGKTAVYDNDVPMAFAGYLIRVRANSLGNNYFISGYLNSSHGKKTLTNMCKSIVGMANINAQELQDIKIVIPPIELQNNYEKIVKASRKRIAKLQKSERYLDRIFNSLSQKAFLGKV